jgi:hypothetical protein
LGEVVDEEDNLAIDVKDAIAKVVIAKAIEGVQNEVAFEN